MGGTFARKRVKSRCTSTFFCSEWEGRAEFCIFSRPKHHHSRSFCSNHIASTRDIITICKRHLQKLTRGRISHRVSVRVVAGAKLTQRRAYTKRATLLRVRNDKKAPLLCFGYESNAICVVWRQQRLVL